MGLIAMIGLQDGLGWDDLVVFCTGALGVLTFVGFIFRPMWVRLSGFLTWTETFREDWDGIPSRPGHSAMPGVMDRLNKIDGEFSRNGGSTMKDALFVTNRQLEGIKDDVGEVKNQINDGDVTRHQILTVVNHHANLTSAAFQRAGLEPPIYTEPPGIIESNELPK